MEDDNSYLRTGLTIFCVRNDLKCLTVVCFRSDLRMFNRSLFAVLIPEYLTVVCFAGPGSERLTVVCLQD